jgi:hypothetical protein
LIWLIKTQGADFDEVMALTERLKFEIANVEKEAESIV